MNAATQGLERIKKTTKNFLTGFSIGGPVGDWARGAKNVPEDVEAVQLLLEHVAKKQSRKEFNPQGIDGKISRIPGRSKTVKAIRAFQHTFMKTPDGRVDPDGRTLQKLREAVTGTTPTSLAAAQSIMKVPQPGDGKPPWLYAFNGFGFFDLVSLLLGEKEQQPKWISIAEEEIGTAEIDGKEHNPRILEYHRTTGAKETDENPWCSSFVNWVLEKGGYEGTDSAWSHSWKSWGDGVSKPAVGSVAFIDWGRVYADKKNKGHVGFVVGKTANDRIVLLGGNQSGKVAYSAFRKTHIVTYRVPKGYQVDQKLYELPVLKVSKGGSSYESTR